MTPPETKKERRSMGDFLLRTARGNLTLALGLAAAGGVGLTLYHGLHFSFQNLLPPCPTYALLKLRCPACGGTRALEAFLHGDIAGAFYYHPIFTLIFILCAALWVFLLFNALRRPYRPLRAPFSFTVRHGLILGVIIVAFVIFRNLPFYPLMK